MEQETKKALWLALGYAGQLAYVIVIPLVALALTGRFLDKKWGTDPWLFLAGIILSVIVSSLWAFLKASQIMAKANLEESLSKKEEKTEKL